jgi:hypothetical protein
LAKSRAVRAKLLAYADESEDDAYADGNELPFQPLLTESPDLDPQRPTPAPCDRHRTPLRRSDPRTFLVINEATRNRWVSTNSARYRELAGTNRE